MPLIPVPPTRAVDLIYANEPPSLYDPNDAITTHCNRCGSSLFLGTQRWVVLFPNTGKPVTIFALYEMEYDDDEKVSCFRCGEDVGFRSPVDEHPGKFNYIWTLSRVQLKDVYHKKMVEPIFDDDEAEGVDGLKSRGVSKLRTRNNIACSPARSSASMSLNDVKSHPANNLEKNVSVRVSELCQTVRELQNKVHHFSTTPNQTNTGGGENFEMVGIALKEVQTKAVEINKLMSENAALHARIKDLEKKLDLANKKATARSTGGSEANGPLPGRRTMRHVESSSSSDEDLNHSPLPGDNTAIASAPNNLGAGNTSEQRKSTFSRNIHSTREPAHHRSGNGAARENISENAGSSNATVPEAMQSDETVQMSHGASSTRGRGKRPAPKSSHGSQTPSERLPKKPRTEPLASRGREESPSGWDERPNGGVPLLRVPSPFRHAPGSGTDSYRPRDPTYRADESPNFIPTGPRRGRAGNRGATRGARGGRGGRGDRTDRGVPHTVDSTFPGPARPVFSPPPRVHHRFDEDTNSYNNQIPRNRPYDEKPSVTNNHDPDAEQQSQNRSRLLKTETTDQDQQITKPVVIKSEPGSSSFQVTPSSRRNTAKSRRKSHITAQDVMSRAAVHREDVMDPRAI